MKTFFSIIFVFAYLSTLSAQQMDIQGNPASNDPVANIQVNYSGPTNVIGLEVRSIVDENSGWGGSFLGGKYGIYGSGRAGYGVFGFSPNGTGILCLNLNDNILGIAGSSFSGIGVFGESSNHIGVDGRSIDHYAVSGISFNASGAYFKGSGGVAMELGGEDSEWGADADDAVIRSQENQGQGDLILVSNDVIALHMDEDDNSAGRIEAYNGANDKILDLKEGGNLQIKGGIACQSTDDYAIYAHNTGKYGAYFKGGNGVAMELGGVDSDWGYLQDDAVIRSEVGQPEGDLILVSNDIIAMHLDDDANSGSRLEVYNGEDNKVMNLDENGNLSLTGSCSCSSDINRKEKITQVDPNQILAQLIALPISEWQFKGEDIRHQGPMAQDFNVLFGLGPDYTSIATVDADGVALAAIQALKKKVDLLKQKNTEMKEGFDELKDIIDALVK